MRPRKKKKKRGQAEEVEGKNTKAARNKKMNKE